MNVRASLSTLRPTRIATLALSLSILCGSAQADGPSDGGSDPSSDIVDALIDAGNFDTLVFAVQQAGLEGALRADGPLTLFSPTDDAFAKLDPVLLSGTYTIFAPTNAAFDALPDGVLDSPLADKDALTDVLLYHVVGGARFAREVTTSAGFRTVQGERIRFSTDGVDFFVNDAPILATDAANANGVVHTIGSVLIPQGS